MFQLQIERSDARTARKMGNCIGVNPSACLLCGRADAQPFLQAPDRFHGRKTFYALCRCPNCSLVWLKDVPRPEEMEQHYGAKYDRFISVAGDSSPAKWRERLKTIKRYRTGGALLDLGCSSGAFLGSLEPENWMLYGIEMSEAVARKAEARTGARVFVGDILNAPFSSETLDVITCFDVLEHVYNPHQVMSRVFEWLKPGGVFYVLVPNIDSGEARAFKSYWYGLELPRHLSHFCPESLRHLAKSVGLEELSVETGRNSALEYSLRYVNTEILRRVGIRRVPLAEAGAPSIAWKAARKLLRWSIYRAIYYTTSLVGAGESIHAVFQKPLRPRNGWMQSS
jgi:2-polyprenyl-3-methyl-5-hydroxy-6-metoxy-1,4-benzoquinol methylase